MGSCLSCRRCQRYFYYLRARRALKVKNRRVGGGGSIEFNDLIDVNDGVLDDFALAANDPVIDTQQHQPSSSVPFSVTNYMRWLSDQEEALRVEGSFDPAAAADASARPLIIGSEQQQNRLAWQHRLQQQQRVGSGARLRASSAAGQLSPNDSDERRSLDLDWDHEPEMLSSMRRSNLMLRSATEEDLAARALAREAEAEAEAETAAEAASDFDLFPGQTAAEAAGLNGVAEASGEQLLLPADDANDELEWSHEFDTGGLPGFSMAASAPAAGATFGGARRPKRLPLAPAEL